MEYLRPHLSVRNLYWSFFSIMQGKGFINFVDGAKMIELN